MSAASGFFADLRKGGYAALLPMTMAPVIPFLHWSPVEVQTDPLRSKKKLQALVMLTAPKGAIVRSL